MPAIPALPSSPNSSASLLLLRPLSHIAAATTAIASTRRRRPSSTTASTAPSSPGSATTLPELRPCSCCRWTVPFGAVGLSSLSAVNSNSSGSLSFSLHERYEDIEVYVTTMKRSFWNSVAASFRYCSFSSSSPSSDAALNVLKNGDVLKQSRIFSASDILDYSKLTLDSNPLHFDSEIARNCGFADVPVPGLLVASLFPRIIASHFPGAIYVKQSLEFRFPVFVGDEIVGEVKATNIRHMNHKYMVKFITTCFKDGGAVMIGGEATALLPSLAVKEVNMPSI